MHVLQWDYSLIPATTREEVVISEYELTFDLYCADFSGTDDSWEGSVHDRELKYDSFLTRQMTINYSRKTKP
jgi:hypothetical protein